MSTLEEKLLREPSAITDEITRDEKQRMAEGNDDDEGGGVEDVLDAVDLAKLEEIGRSRASWVGKSTLERLDVDVDDEYGVQKMMGRAEEARFAAMSELRRLEARRNPFAANSGVKSVIEDKRLSDMDERIAKDRKALEFSAIAKRAGSGAVAEGPSISVASTYEAEKGHLKEKEEEEEEDDFMVEYRKKRLQELQAKIGPVVDIGSQDEFLEITNGARPVVAHLSDPVIGASVDLDEMLPRLAGILSQYTVVRAPCSIVAPSFDPVALPCVILYRKGQTVEALVALSTILQPITPESLATLIQKSFAMNT